MALAMKAPPDNPLTEMSVASTLTDGSAPLPVPLAEKAKRRKAPSWYFIIFSVVVTDSCVVLSVEVRFFIRNATQPTSNPTLISTRALH